MKIRMKTLAAGPSGVFPAGAVRDVDEKEGRGLIAGGYAEDLTPKPAPAPEKKAPETAAGKGGPEKAAVPPGQPKAPAAPEKKDEGKGAAEQKK